MTRTRALVFALVLAGCSGRVRPRALDEATAAATTPQARVAQQLAPASFAEAEKYRRDAEAASHRGDPSSAQALAERALVAYERAFFDARAVRAEGARTKTATQLEAAQADLRTLADEQARVEAEVRELEMRANVARDARPIVASGPSDPARERARLDAARSLATEARLLCTTARLIGADPGSSARPEATVSELAKALEGPARPAPVDLALRARAECLALVTRARHASRDATDDPSDALLADLSRDGSFAPTRDDRGVVVSLHGAFDGEALSAAGTARLAALANVAAAHARTPLLAVLHDGDARVPADRDARRAEAVRKALGRGSLEVALAGATRPLVDSAHDADRARNERLEVVFVDTGR